MENMTEVESVYQIMVTDLGEEDEGSYEMTPVEEGNFPEFRLKSGGFADFLEAVSAESSEDSWDLPVFLYDGCIMSSRLIIGSICPWLKEELLSDGSCLVIPDVDVSQFALFQSALLSSSNELTSLSSACIRLFGIPFPEELLEPPREARDVWPPINYSFIFQNKDLKSRVYRSLGTAEIEANTLSSSSLSRIAEEEDEEMRLFSSLSFTFEHRRSTHDESLLCKICERKFVDSQSLKKHKLTLHSRKTVGENIKAKDNHHCEYCNITFAFAVSLKKHRWLIHSKPNKKNALKAITLMSSASNIQEKPSGSLLSENNPIEEVDSLSKPNYKQLLKERGKREKFEDMRCNLCSQYFTTWKQLQIHMMDHTRERPFKCQDCGKGFKEISKLRRHSVSHSGVKNFPCRFCGKAFSLKHNMKTHEKIHTGEGVLCKYCGKKFTQAPNLKPHELKHIKKSHVITDDPETMKKQTFSWKQSRPFSAKKQFDDESRSNEDNSADHKLDTILEGLPSTNAEERVNDHEDYILKDQIIIREKDKWDVECDKDVHSESIKTRENIENFIQSSSE